MPVTKTASRALKVSKRKTLVNKKANVELEIALRTAKTSGKENDIRKAVSLVDRSVKRFLIHKNKASRMKSKLYKSSTSSKPVKKSGKTAPKKASKKK